jgi:Tol biopolymer transport system component
MQCSKKNPVILTLALVLICAIAYSLETSHAIPNQQDWPVVLFDQGHSNYSHHKTDQVFDRFLSSHGFIVMEHKSRITAAALDGVDVFHTSNALAPENVDNWTLPTPSAFTPDEIRVLLDWVRGGGSLLLAIEHMPFGGSYDDLATAFGIKVSNGFVVHGTLLNDYSEENVETAARLLFLRNDGSVADHQIINGQTPYGSIEHLATDAGTAFHLPAYGTSLITLGSDAVSLEPEKSWEFDSETARRNVAGWSQAGIMEVGQGRVAVLGDNFLISAPAYLEPPYVENEEEAQLGAFNHQFTLNLYQWLTRRLDGQIVFESERDGQTEIYVMDVDGSDQQRLTYTVGNGRRSSLPHWSPDRRKIAFSTGVDRHMEIYIMDRDGSDVRRIWKAESTQSEAWGPQWSPDGRRMVFVSNSGGNYDIYTMDNNGSNVRRLTHVEGSGKASEDPVWSPNGKWIVFNSNRDGIWEIYVMRSDGSDVRRLTYTPGKSMGAGKPAWSPDGKSILFPSSQGPTATNWYNVLDIYVIDADGSNLQRLTHTGDNGSPIWSPDGKRIAFSSHRSGDSTHWRDNREIYVMNADGSNVQRLTYNGVWDSHPQW